LTESEPDPEDLEPLKSYLGCEEVQDDMLETILESKADGTCKWLELRGQFDRWISPNDESRIWLYWLHGPTGTGKSVVAAHVIELLCSRAIGKQDFSYFFFLRGNKFHRSVSSLLRSFAFQMADQHDDIKQEIRNIQKSGTDLEEADEKTIWKKLFVNCILKFNIASPQYWIIDALDECSDASKLLPLLKSAKSHFRLRIFLTSRTLGDIRNYINATVASTKIRFTEDTVASEDTADDIKTLLQAKDHEIHAGDEDARAKIVSKIVHNSQGSFIWADIVLREMSYAFTDDDIARILEDLPSDMVPHYEGILEHMAEKHHLRKDLIITILRWTVCCAKPLTTEQLQAALKWDIGESINAMAKVVETLCGHVLVVNNHGTIKLIHATLREFLLQKDSDSQFAIRKDRANCDLARACLLYLISSDIRPQTKLIANFKKPSRLAGKASAFAKYAAEFFALHLVRARADDEEIWGLLLKFLRSPNVLWWIQYVAEEFKSLEHVKEAGANLRRYAERRSKALPPTSKELAIVAQWGVDLIRIVSKFGRQVLDVPDQMPKLLPPMCPRISRIYQQFAKNPDLEVAGISDEIWADAIAYIEHTGSERAPTSMACGTYYFAFGHSDGHVRLFSTESLAEVLSLEHEEAVENLAFDTNGHHLITAGPAVVTFWNIADTSTPKELWSRTLESPCLGFFFADDDEMLVAACKDASLIFLPLDDEDDPHALHLPHDRDSVTHSDPNLRVDHPICSCFAPDGNHIAFAYKTRPICLWNVGEGSFHRSSETLAKLSSSAGEVNDMLFNPNTDLPFLVVAYEEGRLDLIAYHEMADIQTIKADCHSLAATPDGRTLATGDSKGSIQLWDFETLNLLYRIDYHSHSVGALLFSRDGRRLFDMRDSHSVIWEPAVLFRNNDEDDGSSISSKSVSFKAVEVVKDYEDPVEISAIDAHPTAYEAVVGKDDGSVSVYDLLTGEKIEDLFTVTPGQSISHIAISSRGVIACASSCGSIALANAGTARVSVSNAKLVQQLKFTDEVLQLTFSGSGERLLIAGRNYTHIFQVKSGVWTQITEPQASPTEDGWMYFPCAEDPGTFRLVDKRIDEFDNSQLGRKLTHRDSTMSTSGWRNHKLRICSAVTDPEKKFLIVEYEGPRATRHLVILEKVQPPSSPSHLSPPGDQQPASSSSDEPDCYRLLEHLRPHQCRMFLGLYRGRAVYLGPHLWVWTLDLQHLVHGAKSHRRKHFFVPHEYIGGNHRVQAVVGAHGEVVFPRRGELAIVRGGETYFVQHGGNLG
jgi:WD40 repeat protein